MAETKNPVPEKTFATELEALINSYSMENASNTPDFILTHYLLGCLLNWNTCVQQREVWYGREACSISSVAMNQPPSPDAVRLSTDPPGVTTRV